MAAARIVHGATPEDEERARRRRTRVWAAAAVLAAVGVGAGIAIGLVSGGEPRPEPDPGIARWREVTGLVLSLGGLLGLIVGGVVAWRAGLFRGLSDWPTMGLARHQQQLLTRQVAGKVPADPERLPLARALAHRLALQGKLRLGFVGLGVQQLGQALRADGGGGLALPLLGLVCLLAAVVALTVQTRRAQRFLVAHPDPHDPA